MTEQEREKLNYIVIEKLESLKDEIIELQELTKPIPLDASIGRVSRMDAINNKTINEASLREKKNTFQKMEKTLDRINSEDFGVCLKCGEEIPFGRLEYMPYTTRCVNCVR